MAVFLAAKDHAAAAAKPLPALIEQRKKHAGSHDGWIVKVDLAGVSLEDLEITIDGAKMTISGCRRDSSFGEGLSCHQLEIRYNTFEKTLSFPCSIDGATLLRDYSDGLLILHLRSKEECFER